MDYDSSYENWGGKIPVGLTVVKLFKFLTVHYKNKRDQDVTPQSIN